MSRTKALVASYVGVLVYAGLVFVGAWKLRYWQGALYVVLAILGTTMSHLLMPKSSDLTVRRVRDANTGQAWDKRLLGILFIVNAAMFVIAGMDSGHFLWSGQVPPLITVFGAALMIVGQVVFALAKRENAFFSSTVQMQAEHQVCEAGLYQWVRHPGYLGMLLSVVAFPLVMGSYWAFAPAAIGAAVLVIRTMLEDRFLLDALPGYSDYAAKIQFRLIPGVF